MEAYYAILFGMFFGTLLLVTFILGWYLSSRNCDRVAKSYAKILAQVEILETRYEAILRDNISLGQTVHDLEAKYKTALQEINRLSADLAAVRNEDY